MSNFVFENFLPSIISDKFSKFLDIIGPYFEIFLYTIDIEPQQKQQSISSLSPISTLSFVEKQKQYYQSKIINMGSSQSNTNNDEDYFLKYINSNSNTSIYLKPQLRNPRTKISQLFRQQRQFYEKKIEKIETEYKTFLDEYKKIKMIDDDDGVKLNKTNNNLGSGDSETQTETNLFNYTIGDNLIIEEDTHIQTLKRNLMNEIDFLKQENEKLFVENSNRDEIIKKLRNEIKEIQSNMELENSKIRK